MTIWRGVFASVFACALIARAAPPNVEFSGVLTADGKTRVALTDKATDTTQWVETGTEFGGYRIARYDQKEEAVFLSKNGEEFRLGLIGPKTPLAPRTATMPAANAPSTSSPSTEAAINAIRSNLRTLAAAARQYQAERRVTTVSYSDLVGPGKFISELKPVAGENYAALNFSPNVASLSVTMADGSSVAVDMSPPPAFATVPPPIGGPAPAALPSNPSAPPASSDALRPTGRDASAPAPSPR
jgi:hypothetical protein